jgi:cytochrome c biogenesis protein CcmG, thiol:disulfide interchange protein DsbE
MARDENVEDNPVMNTSPEGSDAPLPDGATGTTVAEASDAPSTSGRKAGIITLAVIVVAILVVLGVALYPKGRTLPADAAGFPAPELSLPRLDGQGTISLAQLAGKPVVVNFWASWCTTCKQEAPTMVAAEKKWRDQGVVFLGVDAVDKDDAAKAFQEQYGMEYVSGVDPGGDAASLWRVTAYPETFFIGRDGTIVSAVRTGLDEATLDDNIAQIAG